MYAHVCCVAGCSVGYLSGLVSQRFVMALYWLFSLDIPGLCWAGRVVQGVGFAYISVSAVAHGAHAHGEMLACYKPHDQKAGGSVRDLVG